MIRYFLAIILLLSLQVQGQTFSGTGGSVPDAAPGGYFDLPVTGLSSTTLTHAFGLVRVCININHTYDGDLEAKLIAPDGTVVSLFTNIGGGGDNFTATCFDSVSTSPGIGSGTPPFTGTFLPEGCLGNINNGQNGNGTWRLFVQDDAASDTGIVVDWQLTFGSNAPTPFAMSTDLPLVMLNTHGQTILDGPRIFANMKVIDNGTGMLNHSTDPGNVYDGTIDISIRGASSASYPQKSYVLTTYQADSTTDSNVVFFGMPSEHDWILLSGYNDKSFIRNTLMFRLFNSMGHYATRTRHCEVMLNGEYMGVYIFMEKIKRDANRVNISKLRVQDTTGDQLTGGYIFEHNFPYPGWTTHYAPDSCNTRFYEFKYSYPSGDSIRPQQASYIQHVVDTLENRLYGPLPIDPVWGYRPKINSSSFVDYFLCNEMSWNNDGFKKSMFFHKTRDSHDPTLHAGPIWDFDWSLKRMPWTPTDVSGWMYTAEPCTGDVLFLPWWKIMMTDTVFQNEVRCHWEYFRQHAFSNDSIDHYIDSMALLLNQAQARHFSRWAILGINVGTPEAPPFATSYQEEIDTMKAIIQRRLVWMDANLPGHCYVPYNPDTTTSISIIKTQVSGGVACSPNPATNSFTVSCNGVKATSIKVYSQIGQLVYVQQVPANATDINIDCTRWSSGLYLVSVQQVNQPPILIKVIKQ